MEHNAESTIRIECKDIYLREYRIGDLEHIHALTWQPEIYEWLPGWNVSLDRRTDWLVNYEWKENGQFLKAVSTNGDVQQLRLRLAIVLKETEEVIGWCCTGLLDDLPAPNREIMYGERLRKRRVPLHPHQKNRTSRISQSGRFCSPLLGYTRRPA